MPRYEIVPDPPGVFSLLDGTRISLPALWLRERCQDPESLDVRTRQRLFDPHTLCGDVALTAATPDGEGACWLAFDDGYAGRFDLDLLETDFDPNDGLPAPVPWRGDLAPLPRHRWPGLDRPAAMLDALRDFLRLGFVVLDEVPCGPREVVTVGGAFGFVRDTGFGEFFEVYARPDGNDLAYTARPLGPHTDQPYTEPVPGIQLLHCLANEAPGGDSVLVDALAVCEAIAEEDPAAFELLCTVPVRFRFVGEGLDIVERRPLVRTDALGRVRGVHFSPRVDFLPVLPEAELRAFHAARARLARLLSDPAFTLGFRLDRGSLVMFDNCRLVHGRTAFDPSRGVRHLQGCYIDVNGPRSRYRVLTRAAATPRPAAVVP